MLNSLASPGSDSEIEAKILQLAACQSLSPSAIATLSQWCQTPVNWDYFNTLVLRHRVLPMVVHHLQSIDGVPQPLLQQWQQQLQQSVQRSLILTGTLVALIQTFRAQSLRALAYKGPTLALSCYRDLGLRQFVDIDVWVAPRDYSRAETLLSQQGFRLQSQLSWETNWMNPLGQSVDLHQSLTPPFFPLPLEFDKVYDRAQRVKVAGTEVATLSPEDYLLLLAVNLVRDAWELKAKLIQVCDIAALLNTCSTLDPEEVLHRATQVGCRRIVLVGVALAHDLLDAPLSPPFQRAIAQEPQIASLASQLRPHLLTLTPPDLSGLTTLKFYWRLRERWRERLLYLITPNEDDRQYWAGDPIPEWAYYIVRPWRLVTKSFHRTPESKHIGGGSDLLEPLE